MNTFRIFEKKCSKYLMTAVVIASLNLFIPGPCLGDFAGLLVNYSFPEEISYFPGRPTDPQITFTVKNTGSQSWTACQPSEFERIPAYKCEISNVSWDISRKTTFGLMGRIDPGESHKYESFLGENFLPAVQGDYSFKLQCFFHDTDQCIDRFTSMDGNNPVTVTFKLVPKQPTQSMPWLPLLLLDDTSSDSPYEISYAYLQYRNYPNNSKDRYASFINITKNGEAIEESDAVKFVIKDSLGNELVPFNWGFYRSTPYYFYNCLTMPCTEQTGIIDSGFYVNFDFVSAGDYKIAVEAADGRKCETEIDYPGQLVLPFVSAASMETNWVSEDLVLGWTNPTNAKNWDKVSQLRIVLYAEDDSEVLYIRTNPSANTVTIPASLINSVENLGHGKLSGWLIQTRAYDSNNMNYARGYSH